MPATRQIGAFPLFALALVLTLVLAAFAMASGQGDAHVGRPFVATMIVFACFLSMMMLFAASSVTERFWAIAGPGSAWLFSLVLFLLYLVYVLGTGTASLLRIAAMAGFLFVPLLLLAPAQGAAATWQDFATIAAIWTAVKFGPRNWIWAYPSERLAYMFTVVVAVNLAIAIFLLMRRVKNVGYNIGWGSGWGLYVVGALALFACVAIPLGIRMDFIAYAPKFSEWRRFVPLSIGILFFTAWPEEFLFRGLLQNLLSRTSNSETVGLVTASVLFGLSHITNMYFPNWKYVLLATIAGVFYGWTWRKTGSIFASALVHAGVDILWHFLFRTV